MAAKKPRVQITKMYKQYSSESVKDIYDKFNISLREQKSSMVNIHYKPLAKVIKSRIVLGERLKALGVSMSVASLVLNNFGWYKVSLALASGGLAIQSFYSFVWSRDAIFGYKLQPLENELANEDAALEEEVKLVRKSNSRSYLARGALTFSAVTVSAYLLWKSMR